MGPGRRDMTLPVEKVRPAAESGAVNHNQARSDLMNTYTRMVGAAVFTAMAGGAFAQTQPGNLTVELVEIASGMAAPVQLKHAGDGSGRMFVVDQTGKILIIKEGQLLDKPFLDLSGVISPLNPGYDEKGLLGMAFHPDYAKNGRFFVRYSKQREGQEDEPCFGTSRGCHAEVLAEYQVSGDPDVADPTETLLFSIDKPQFNHNGGGIDFGPDGMLYFSLGDGGGAHDGLADDPPSHGPIGNGQNLETPLGKMLRIDVDSGSPYTIPDDNPLVGKEGLDEIWAWGMRNPYAFSFDDGPGGDGSLWLGEVGQDLTEEVDIVISGGNYGWVIKEGSHCFDPFNPSDPPEECDDEGMIDPIAEYSHDDGGIAIVGGYVYRGSQQKAFAGKYIFGDFSTTFGEPDGHLFYLDPTKGLSTVYRPRIGEDGLDLGLFVKGIGEDEAGEIYLLASTTLGPSGTSGLVLHMVAGPCVPDLNADGSLDLFDFLMFVNLFNGGDAKADCDGNGGLDLFDFLCFVNQFSEGC
jgi:glucose/arabinose dehydrogenase